MPELNRNAQKWLKIIHILFSCLWIGGGISLIAMSNSMTASSGDELYGINRAMRFIDDFIIIPGAFGCFLTGLIYSIFTHWGFFKHNWITVKWIINLTGILVGTFFLGLWLNSLGPISAEKGLDALSDPVYIHNQFWNARISIIQVSTLLFAVYLSVFKPWQKRG